MEGFTALYKEIFRNPEICFNTFAEDNAIHAGEARSAALKKHLGKSNFMIALITDSYLRSEICLSEISAFWYMSKMVMPIVFNDKNGADYLQRLFGADIIYIDAKADAEQSARKMYNTLSSYFSFQYDSEKTVAAIKKFLVSAKQATPSSPYIGSVSSFSNILKYCESTAGISRFTDSSLSINELADNLRNSEKIYIMSTTGANMIHALTSDFIPSALQRGTSFYVFIPNQYSDFCNDVAEIEMPDNQEENATRFANEFANVVTNLKNSVQSAKSCGKTGHIYLGCAETFLRQTITLGVDGSGNAWGWISLTLPPKRTNDKTPSIEFSGNINDRNTMAYSVYNHLAAVQQVIEHRHMLFEVTGSDFAFTNFRLEKKTAKEYWEKKFARAKTNMVEKQSFCTDALIEVAAQHPLMADGTPSKEFQARLDHAAALYTRLAQDNIHAVLYVPGSIHMHNGIVDTQSLSAAGKQYLLAKGIPESALLGDDENQKYKGDWGVYNSADECYVASQLFQHGNFKQLHCVCSPNQMLRKQLFYMEFGVLPYFHTVPCENMAHSFLHELFDTIPDVITNDHDWQSEGSVNGTKTRLERDPNLKK
jgi:hypothetical protein